MIVNILSWVSLLFVVLVLTGCGVAGMVTDAVKQAVHKKETKYLASEQGNQIQIPATVSKQLVRDEYVIPDVAGTPGAKVAPPGSLLQKSKSVKDMPMVAKLPSAAVTMQQQQNAPSLLINASFEQAWLAVNSGMQRKKMKVVSADLEQKSFKVIRRYGFNGRPLRKFIPRTITLTEVAGGVRVSLEEEGGVPAHPVFAQKFLAALQDGLSG